MVPRIGGCRFSLCRRTCRASIAPLQCASRGRRFVADGPRQAQDNDARPTKKQLLDIYARYRSVDDAPLAIGTDGRCVGFLGKRRNLNKNLSFADLTTPSGEIVQICSNAGIDSDCHAKFRQIPAWAPVLVDTRPQGPDQDQSTANSTSPKPTVYLQNIQQLNSVPKELIVTPEVQFPPTMRHLQIRFHPELQARLRFRSWLKAQLTQGLVDKGFIDVETPTLFKSTPEGAREFLVPTRLRGKAYALSQSPQQYKQVLMAGGIARYMQWARCYRDEDPRADRQPEFSQLDMEWAFAGAWRVMRDVDDLVLDALSALHPSHSYKNMRGERVPVVSAIPAEPPNHSPSAHQFTTIKFADSILWYGTDKPDLRIPSRIHMITDLEPIRDFVGMITHLPDPVIEVFKFSLDDVPPRTVAKFVANFMEGLPSSLAENPDGKPQILVHDSSKPRFGLSSLGVEYQTVLDLVADGEEIKDGDLLVFQAREKPVGQYCSGSTKLGLLRSALWKALVDEGHMSTPQLGEPGSLQFAWVTEFPMFKPVEKEEPGQGGAAGIASAHHPFTAPLSQKDMELLFTDPLQAKSAAYDLVLNGIEIGGGSERNHSAPIQEFIMQDVLKMPNERIEDFSHLFEALRAGCPPHAGFALGFDRLTALLAGTPTVRDVMAFPKTMKGEDPFVNSPSELSDVQLAPYHVRRA